MEGVIPCSANEVFCLESFDFVSGGVQDDLWLPEIPPALARGPTPQ